MVYVTGDIHGDQLLWDSSITPFLQKGDVMIVTGDFGIGFFSRYWSEDMFFDYIEEQDYTVVFCDGNHEDYNKLYNYEITMWNGGKVHKIRNNLFHLMRGEIYMIEGKKLFAMGGAYSIDKDMRTPGKTWWSNEMPIKEEYDHAIENLEKHKFQIDYIVTHTAPFSTIEYMSKMELGIRNIPEEYALNNFLQWVADRVVHEYRWYFGHFHIDYELWKQQYVLYNDIREFFTGKVIRRRCIVDNSIWE